MTTEYRHERFTDFSIEKNKLDFQHALLEVKKQLGEYYQLKIGVQSIDTDEKIISMNPARKGELIGSTASASKEHVEQAIQAAQKAFHIWSQVAPEARANVLFKVAAIIRRRKHEFSAYLVFEAGKPWHEADAETAEAIDFLEYYGRQILELKNGVPILSREGERNTFTYIPLGVGVVISPWNFPLAIMAGMTMAAVVCGNTVILKPSSATPIVAAKFFEVLQEAGLPAGVVNYLPGSGTEIGDELIDHPQVRFISFTGSKEVGIRIYERASVVHPEQKWLKRVVAEMGGKDTIIVDSDADLELAAQSIVQSAFGFSGQKCSACSRVVVVGERYEKVVEKVAALSKIYTPSDPFEQVKMGPVIDEQAYKKVMGYIAIGKQEGTVIAGGHGNMERGFYIEPTVIAHVEPMARIMQEEIFGPIVAICQAKDFTEALAIANNTDYGLTGAVISNNREYIERAKREFHVGNLYINRGCTGALVGYHPFGGFNLSGTDSKAGGPDYLLLFMQAKTICEQW